MAGPLDNSPADVVATLLVDLGLVAESGVFVGSEPDQPDTCVTVYDTTNVIQGRGMDGRLWEFHGIQIRARAPRQADAHQLARSIAVALEEDVYDELVTVAAGTGTADAQYLVHACRRTSGPMSLGKQEPSSRLSVYTVNLTVGLKQPS